jgi:hypothetical protein
VIYSDATSANVTTQAIWTSSNTSVATVLPGGVVAGIGYGAATISATYQQMTGGRVVTIRQPSSSLTFLSYSSDQSDWVGQGASGTYTLASAAFSATVLNEGRVTIQVHTPDYSFNWSMSFGTVNWQPFAPGAYEGATRTWDGSTPLLDIGGNGRGCNDVTGRFVVLDVSLSGSTLNRFHATFEQHCEGKTPALRGEIDYVGNPLRIRAPEGRR